MVKQRGVGFGDLIAHVWGFVAWLVGIIVSLAVGFGLTNDILSIRYIPLIVTEVAGWIVVVLSLLGLLLAIIDRMVRK